MMRRPLFLALLLASCLASAAFAADRVPTRIVTLTPSIAEVLWDLGEAGRVAAVVEKTLWPGCFAGLPSVGGYERPNLERILEISPDLVVGDSGIHGKMLERLEELGIPTLGIRLHGSFDDIEQLYRALGTRLGREQAAEAALDRLEARIAEAATHLPSPRPRTLVVVWPDPLVVVGGDSYIDDLFERMGIEHAATGLRGDFPQVSREFLFEVRPELIIVPETHGGGEVVDVFLQEGAKYGLDAAARVVSMDGDLLFRPGPRLGEAAEAIARLAAGTTSGDRP